MIHDSLVIGSGPAAAACVDALLGAGMKVAVIDAGLRLDETRARLVATIRSGDDSDPRPLLGGMIGAGCETPGLPDKRLYGSDVPYRIPSVKRWRIDPDVGVAPSFAVGGHSSVWGAAMLPYPKDEFERWPIAFEDLAPHYRSVLRWLPFSARSDALATRFPLFADELAPLRIGEQASLLLEQLELHADELAAGGISFGKSRLAVRARDDGGPSCRYCGFCVHGCPYGAIFNASDVIHELASTGRIAYLPSGVVDRVEEADGCVTVEGRRPGTGEQFRHSARRVFIACGVLPTAEIVLRSLAVHDRPVVARDSQYFVFPLLRARAPGDVRSESTYSLAQLFMEIDDPGVGSHLVHLQIYGYSESIGERIRAKLGPIRGLPSLERRIAGRVLGVQGFLHSDVSGRLMLSVESGRQGQDSFRVSADPSTSAYTVVKATLRKLRRARRALGAIPLGALLEISPPGRSFHVGGTFPMSANPGPLETDITGRPLGLKRVHVVDASVFPTIAATTITLTVMANAHRIATLVASGVG